MNPEEIRAQCAENLRTIANLRTDAIVEAFARIRREEFLCPPPWQVGQSQLCNAAAPFSITTSARLEDIYQDVVVAIDTARQINNGQPSLHARWLEAASVGREMFFQMIEKADKFVAPVALLTGPNHFA